MLVLAIIILIIGIIALIVSFTAKFPAPAGAEGVADPQRSNRRLRLISFAPLGLGVLLLLLSSFYTQDAGEAKVKVDIAGNITGQTNGTGFQTKAPWENTVTFNIRNQQVIFASDGNSDNNGGTPEGPQITVQDADGVSSNIDIALRYSIKPDSVTEIYKQFRDEETFKTSFIEQDIRSVVRLVPNKYSTIDLLTKRGDVEADILKALESRWAEDGVTVDSISLQEIRVPESVRDSYATAQQAQINVETEKANLEAETVKAQQEVVKAQASADANRLLTQSLTPEVLQQHYIDALGEGTIYVVPEGSTPLIQTTK